MNNIANDYETFLPEPAVGCWIIGSDWHIFVAKRPSWLHRLMARWLLGWKWRDKA